MCPPLRGTWQGVAATIGTGRDRIPFPERVDDVTPQDLMQEIARAILLPPPNPPLQRSQARGASALDRDLPEEPARAARRSGAATASFLTLIEATPEDTVELGGELKGKQFRFRPYGRGGATERPTAEGVIERFTGTDNGTEAVDSDPSVAAEILDGYASGTGSRNSTAFLASFIAQERLSEGLYNPPYGAASDAYRRAGGSPPAGDAQPRVVSLAA